MLKLICPSEIGNLREFWGFYAQDNNSTPHSRPPLLLEELFSSPLEVKGEKLALDLGSGRGTASLYLLERGWKVIAVDYSVEALNVLKQRIDTFNEEWLKTGQLTVIESPIDLYDFPQLFHLVVAHDVFPYLNPGHLRHVWVKIHKALAQNGHLVGSFFLEPHKKREIDVLKEMGAWFMENMDMVQELLAVSSYKNKTCRYMDGVEQRIIEFAAQPQKR